MKSLFLSRLAILSVVLLACCMNAGAQTTTFNFNGTTGAGNSGLNGTPQSYVVPPGVTQIGVDMWGGKGGFPCCSNNASRISFGGRVQCTMNVTPGTTLYVYVGGGGTDNTNTGSLCPGGWNGGAPGGGGFCAGGGGASDIRTSTSGSYATSVLVVAGGGGGGGDFEPMGGPGGNIGTGGIGGTGQTSSLSTSGGACGGGQTGPSCSTGSALGTQGNGGSCSCYAQGGGGGGWWGGNGGTTSFGGGGGGSSYPATSNSVVTAITHTQGYTLANGNGRVTITVLCTSPGSITGTASMCIGGTTTLANPTATGGFWQSSNPAVATVGSATGDVTGVTAGTAIITYVLSNPCGGFSATQVVTVNPNPTAITGTGNACIGQPITYTNSTSGGVWSSSNTSVATIGSSSGVINGTSVGSVNITYRIPSTGCLTTLPTVVNATPPSITGVMNACTAGGTTTLSNAAPGGTWSSGSTGVASVTGTGVVTGVSVGSAVITYTAPTGCFVTTSVLINPLPSPSTGTPVACVGGTTTLANTGGGTWSTANPALATVGASSGEVSGVGAGTVAISYTLPTGCSIATPVLINPLPSPITGTLSMCAGGSTTLSSTTSGGIWSSSNPSVASVIPTTGVVSGTSAGSVTISYSLGTGCAATATAVVDPLPTVFDVTGGGGYCVGTSGVHIGVNFASSGVNYKLYNGSTLVSTVGGSNAGLDFGLFTATGTYTVVAVNSATGCAASMNGSATVSINPLPNTFTVTGGGNFCPGGAGVHVNLSGSDPSVSYQLYLGSTSAGGAMTGTGGPLDFGAITTPGTYTAVATNTATGCSSNMAGSATIGLHAVPNVYNMNAGGAFCTGGTGVSVTLSGSDISTNYQLYLGGVATGTPVSGTGAALNFGMRTTPGVYTATAVNSITGCTAAMGGASTVVVNPLPNIYAVSGGGSYCAGGAGVHVGLNFSNTGINYQLYRGTTPVGPLVPGSNAGLDMGAQTVAGTYSIIAIDAATGCQRTMSGTSVVSINPLPNTFTVTGGGNYCTGGIGLHVGLSSSNTGIQYQLYHNSLPVGVPMSGTGAALDFGLRLAPGTYTVMATNLITSCSANMLGSATINVNTLPLAYTVTGIGTSFCAGDVGIDIVLSGSDFGITYQLYRGATAVGSPMPGAGTSLDFGYQTTGGVYTVKATDVATGCTSTMTGSATVIVNALPTAYAMTGGGSYCNGGTGVHVTLGGSNVGINYQLYNSGGAVGGPVAGTGAGLDFGLQTVADGYFVIATDAISGCIRTMTGLSTVAINNLPDVHLVVGGGNYCFGASGVTVGLDLGDMGISYQLYNGTSPSGSPVLGTNTSLDFGLRTAPGTYTVVATNTSTSCVMTQGGSVSIAVNPLPVAQTVTGGGTYCAGGAGLSVTLANSNTGTFYELFHSGSSLGTMSGTGAGLDFGPQMASGSYNVIATDSITGCSGNMTGSATINIEAQPTVQTMSGGGTYCAGGTGVAVGLGGSETGINYQLYNGTSPVGGVMAGTGSPLSFGLRTAPGTYTVVASPSGVCVTNMSGTSVVTITPLPNPYALTGGGSYCASGTGVAVGLSGSDGSVVYQLYRGTTPVGSPVTGTGSALSFGMQTATGSYSLIATDTITGCSTNMTSSGTVSISTMAQPIAYNVTGGGSYCTGGSGVHITLAGSNTNINYQLYHGATAVGAIEPGTGTMLDFGLYTAAGNYTVIGTDAASLCTNNMNDTASVSINPILTPVVTVVAHPGTVIVKNQVDTLVATATNAGTNPKYQWLLNGFPIIGATNSTFISNRFVNNDSLVCQVTSSGACGGVTTNKLIVITVNSGVGVQQFSSSANINVIPNPNKGVFSIVGELGTADDQELNVEVLDLLGHTVYSGKVTAVNGSLNAPIQLGNVANGMYILNLRSATENKVFHIVIEQ